MLGNVAVDLGMHKQNTELSITLFDLLRITAFGVAYISNNFS